MDLLIAANTVTQAQADKAPTSGTPGWATDGNPATGLLATDAPAWHYNMMMAELMAVINAAGITPSNADWSQVLKAMQTIFAPAQYGVAPFSASLAQLIGGYPLGAIAFDAAGNYWRSTRANNLTVPGAENADWVNFFTGVMTQPQADLRYLLLTGGNVTGGMDWGDKNAAATLTHRFWSAGPPTTGTATPDATLTASSGTPGTPNAGTLALATGLLDLSATKQVMVPSPTAFDGKQALSAGAAEERYVRSVPASDSTNARITDIAEDTSGDLIATLSDGTTKNYIPSGQIVQANSAYVAASGGNGNIITAEINITLTRKTTILVTGCSNFAYVTTGQSGVSLAYNTNGGTFTSFGTNDVTCASCIYVTGTLVLDAGSYTLKLATENGNNAAIGWSAVLSYIAVSV